MSPTKHFRVTLTRSPSGATGRQRRTLAGLGLRRLRQTVALRDTPAIRGMVAKMVHWLAVCPTEGALPASSRMQRRAAAQAEAAAGR